MRTSLALSLVMHGVLLAVALVGFGSSREHKTVAPVAVNVVTPGAISAVKAGKQDQAPNEAVEAAPSADKPSEAASAETAKSAPAQTVAQKQAALPPPKPASSSSSGRDAKPEPRPRRESETRGPPSAPAIPPSPKRAGPEPRQPETAARSPRPERPRPEQPQRSAPRDEPQPRGRDDRIADLIDRPTLRAEGESNFDPTQIAALLNRDPTAGVRPPQEGPREPWRRPSSLQEQAAGFAEDATDREAHGAPSGRDRRMTANEIDAFRAQVSRCWTPPVGGLGGDAIVVKLRIGLREDGTLDQPPEVANSLPSPFFRPAADSAVRAVVQCQPYRMPPEKFSQWRDMLLTFDPSLMYGG